MINLKILNELVKDKNVATVAPSSPAAIECVSAMLPQQSLKLILEYGPGTGAFTQELLKHLRADGMLVAFETNATFVEDLRQSLTDPRLIIVNESAHSVAKVLGELQIQEADLVLSGIPFSLIDEKTKREIIGETAEILAPSGSLITYQAHTLIPDYDPHLRPYLEEKLEIVQTDTVMLNIPPLRIYRAVRKR